jgi:hypothetical protein
LLTLDRFRQQAHTIVRQAAPTIAASSINLRPSTWRFLSISFFRLSTCRSHHITAGPGVTILRFVAKQATGAIRHSNPASIHRQVSLFRFG